MTTRTNPELKIISVSEAGVQGREYLMLEAITDIPNLDDFMVMDLTFGSQSGKSNLVPHCYRFPAKPSNVRAVKAGDNIFVYTGRGHNSASPFGDPKAFWVHYYYMNLKTTIWNQSGDTATVLYCEVVDSKKV